MYIYIYPKHYSKSLLSTEFPFPFRLSSSCRIPIVRTARAANPQIRAYHPCTYVGTIKTHIRPKHPRPAYFCPNEASSPCIKEVWSDAALLAVIYC